MQTTADHIIINDAGRELYAELRRSGIVSIATATDGQADAAPTVMLTPAEAFRLGKWLVKAARPTLRQRIKSAFRFRL